MEATHCYKPATGRDTSGKVLALAEYAHGTNDSISCAIIGGFVDRGAATPALDGRCFFGDNCSGTIWDVVAAGPASQAPEPLLASGVNISGWGQGPEERCTSSPRMAGRITWSGPRREAAGTRCARLWPSTAEEAKIPDILRSQRTRWLAPSLIAVAVALAGCNASSPTVTPSAGQPSTSAAGSSSGAAATPTVPATPTPRPTPSPSPTIGPCSPVAISIEITSDSSTYWQGAAGQHSAKCTLTNSGSTDCIVRAKSQPLLLNGDGAVLITGPAAGTSTALTVAAGSTLTTQVQTGNLCHAPTIVAPVRIAFVMPGIGTEIATKATATDTGGIPPCNGDPNVTSGDISMQVWAP